MGWNTEVKERRPKGREELRKEPEKEREEQERMARDVERKEWQEGLKNSFLCRHPKQQQQQRREEERRKERTEWNEGREKVIRILIQSKSQ